MERTIPISEGGEVNAIGRAEGVDIEIIASLTRTGDTNHVSRLHFTKNSGGLLGSQKLQEFARDFLKQHGSGAKRLVVEGAPRTTGANPGVPPRRITIRLE